MSAYQGRSYDSTTGNAQAVRENPNDFSRLSQAIGSKIQSMTQNVNNMQQLVNQIGTPQDNPSLRDKLHQVQHYTNQVAKDTSQMLQDVTHLPQSTNVSEQRQRKMVRERLTNEFSTVLKNFQSLQRSAKDKEKDSLARAKQNTTTNRDPFADDKGAYEDMWGESSVGVSQQQAQKVALEQDSDLQLLQQRERDIRQLESDISDVNQIFKDLGTLVHEQGEMIDSIEANVESTQIRVESGVTELQKARNYQTAARKKKICIAVVLLVVVGVLVLILALTLRKK